WHCSGYERSLCDRGLCNFIPMIFRNLAPYYRHFLTVNVAMVCATPMDKHGFFNLSCGSGVAKAILDKADVVIIEVNENLPKVSGGYSQCISVTDVDMIVEGEHGPLPEVPDLFITPAEETIAGLILELIPNGATLQLGIGSMPNALGKMIAKSDLKDFGMHTELCSDAYVDLAEAGKLTNKKKTYLQDVGVTGMAFGTKRTYEYVDENPCVTFMPLEFVNAAEIIARNDNMISINNCIAVDLFGQVTAESAGTRQISGTGGQLDYLTGAAMSKGGKAFICLTSTFTDKSGKVHSNIRPTFHGDIVTDPRSQAYYLVTEYGRVNLVGKTTWERAEDIISLAHPDFREALIAEAEELGIWRRSNKR
ncbi:MAG: butyryl-CoA:acetate CoA-transferase, partial [Firmicutes bacterium]|nr:butyryl-CoA:acetate CoA-transferase [Bacillota bacterium]